MRKPNLGLLGAALALGIVVGASDAKAADYYVGVPVDGQSDLWVYQVSLNQLKLCYPASGSQPIACTPTRSVFTTVPPSTDVLTYRPVPGLPALWIIDITKNTAALCEVTVSGTTYALTVTLATGVN